MLGLQIMSVSYDASWAILESFGICMLLLLSRTYTM